jgi:hypothetical protein
MQSFTQLYETFTKLDTTLQNLTQLYQPLHNFRKVDKLFIKSFTNFSQLFKTNLTQFYTIQRKNIYNTLHNFYETLHNFTIQTKLYKTSYNFAKKKSNFTKLYETMHNFTQLLQKLYKT